MSVALAIDQPLHLRLVEDLPWDGILPGVGWYYQHTVKHPKVCRAPRRTRIHHEQIPLHVFALRAFAAQLLADSGPTVVIRLKAHSIGARRLTIAEQDEKQRLDSLPVIQWPRTRADCKGGQRPCVRVGCRHNLYLDVNPKNGSIKLNFPGIEPQDMEESCVLDLVDANPHGVTLDKVALHMNLTMERIRQIEKMGAARLKQTGAAIGAEYMDSEQ